MASSTHATKGYVRGKASDVHESHHHVLPLKLYMQVFGALMVLTVLTVLVSYANLGSASLIVAMIVATIKAAAVVGFFMHLRYDTRFHSFVFFSTLLFVAIFFALTFFDINTRDHMVEDFGNEQRMSDAGELHEIKTRTVVYDSSKPDDAIKLEKARHYLESHHPVVDH